MTQHHNEIRDLIHDLTTFVWNQTTKEPIVREASRNPPQDALIVDISTRVAWQPQYTAIFDIRVIDSDATSYLSKTPEAVLRSAEREKKLKYNTACEAKHASFTPLCITSDGHNGDEMKDILSTQADRLASKWNQQYALTLTTLDLNKAIIRTDSRH